MYYAERLAHWGVDLKFEAIPSDVIDTARQCLADWLCITAYGSGSPWGQALVEIVEGMGGRGEATIIGRPGKFPSPNAAMANAVMALSYDLSDTFLATALHPSCSVVASSLALAEREGVGGRELLTAIVLGYELAARVGEALNKGPDRFISVRGYEANAVVPVFGSAAAAAKLLRLDRAQMANAIALAGASMGGGMIEYLIDGNWTYRWNPGRTAHDGILNALMAQRGFMGPPAVFEGQWDDKGRYGVINAFAGDMSYADEVIKGLGERWHIREIGFKYYGCCHYIHGCNDAALRLMAEHRIGVEDIEEITAFVPHMTLFLAIPREMKVRPLNLTMSQWSLPFCLATTILDGHLLNPRRQLSEARLKEPRVLELADKIKVIRDRGLDEVVRERGELLSPIKIRLRNGQEYEVTSSCKGFRQNPLTPEEFDQKFDTLMSTILLPARTAQVREALNKLEKIEVEELMALLAA